MVTRPTPRWPIPIQHSYQSLTYIPLGLVFMAIRDRTSLYISNIGRLALHIKRIEASCVFFSSFSGTAVRFADETDPNVLRHGYFVSAFSSSAQNLVRNYSTSKDALLQSFIPFQSDFLWFPLWFGRLGDVCQYHSRNEIFGTCSRCVFFKHLFFFFPDFFPHPLFLKVSMMWFWRSGDFPLHRGDQLLVGSRVGADQPGTIQSQAASWGNPGAGGQTPRGPWVGCPESTGGNCWELLRFEFLEVGKTCILHDMLAEDDSNVYLVSKSVKENFFKFVETDEFIWKKLWWLMTSHDNLQNSPPVQLTDPFFAIQDRVETAPWFWSWPWLPILQFKVCHVGLFVLFQKLFSGFYMIE